MPRTPKPWFRLYTEALYDSKLCRLPPAQRWVWIAVLGAARQSPVPGSLIVALCEPLTDRDLARLAQVGIKDVRAALEAFERYDMIHLGADGAWCVTHWDARQFETDDVNIRSRRHREKQRGSNVATNGGSNVARGHVATPPETETETETESTTSSSDSRGPDEPVDNYADDRDIVPQETWDAYAEIALRRRTDVTNPVPWKRSTAATAREQHGTLAALWWQEFDLTPRRLAECLMDGQIRNVQHRAKP